MHRLLSLVDRLSGAKDLDAEASVRVRFIFLASLLLGVMSGLAGVSDLARGQFEHSMANFLSTLSCVFVVIAWRTTRSLLVCAHVAAGYDAFLFTVLATRLGDPTLLAWLVIPGFVALVLGGWRAGAAWVPITLILATVLALLFSEGVIPLGPEISVQERIWRVAPMPPLLIGMGALFEFSRSRSVRKALEAQLAAERANLARRRFLASVSHEIRTPLNGVLGMTDLLMAGSLEPTLRESLGVIHTSGVTLRALINDLLDLSSAEAGKLTLGSEPFDVRARLRAALGLARAQAKGLTIQWVDELPPVLWVQGEGLRLGQVLSNLLHNAVKFTAQGTVTLGAKAAREDGAWRLVFTVTDTGTGISPEEAAQLFQPFSQLDNARGRGGTGLGLAICRELISEMGGELTVESEVGVGSTFRVRLALPAAPAPAEPALALAEASFAHGGRALVVDDNAINARVARGMMEKLGFQVESAPDGVEALLRLESSHFDVVLMDCEMPRLDGLEATREWRRREASRGGRMPIIALTANAQPENLEACLQAGMDAHLTKPVQLSALRLAVVRYRGTALARATG